MHVFMQEGGERPDVEPGVGFLSTHTSISMQQDWNKLVKLLDFIFSICADILILKAYNSHTLNWHIDAAHAAHADRRSHTGSIFTMGKGFVASSSTKQKYKLHSSTESELNSTDDRV